MKCFLLTVAAVLAFQSITAIPVDLANPIWHITALQSNPGDFAQPFAIKNTLVATFTEGDVYQNAGILNEALLNKATGDFDQSGPLNAGVLNTAGGTFRQKGIVNAGALNTSDNEDIEGVINVQLLNSAKRRHVKGTLNVDLLNSSPDTTYEGLTVGRK